jgi:Glycosyl hydrolases family 43/Concanavalin A-like lectin/glucanases superfamily
MLRGPQLRLSLLAGVGCFCLALVGRAQMPFYGNDYLHDPGTMIKDGASYFIFGDGQGISGITSTDLRNWTATSAVFPGGPPAWTSNSVPGFTGYFWAPDIAYFNGRYNLYYACSQWGTINSAIGLVTSPSLVSPAWTDQGKVIQSNPIFATNSTTDLTAYNCIDPSILVDTNGTVWMSFGSYSDGILIMQLDPTTGKRIAPDSPIYRVSNNGPYFFSNTEEGSCLYEHGGYYYLFVNFGGCCAGVNSTYNIRVGRSTTVTGPYYDRNGVNMVNGGGTMVLESTARYIGPGHAAIMNDNGTEWFTYHYYDGKNDGVATVGMNRIYWTADGWPALTNDWSAFYPFNTDAREHLGLYNGTLRNHAAVTNDAVLGEVLNLDGVTNFVSLPLSVANASTFAAWVKWRGGADWQRIFDFGTGTNNYLFLTPRASSGVMRFAITTNGNGAEQQINAPAALPTNSWVHVAVTLDGRKGLLYLDGLPVATNNALTIRPWQILAKNNYIGKSQWPADPMFAGEISSFRIFGRALSGAEIRDLAYSPPALAHRYSFNPNPLNLVWDSIGMAHGTLMGGAIMTNGALVLDGTAGTYVNLPGGLLSGSSAVTLECWATFGVNSNWARIVDFGNISGSSGQNYSFYSPHTPLGGQRLEMKASTTTTLDTSGTLDNRTVDVVCIVDPANHYAAIYTNGVLESASTQTWPAFTSVSTAWSFIGRSLFSSNAYLNATIDELRTYDGRLTPEQIAVNDEFGPDALAWPMTLAESNAASGWNLTWPAYPAGFVLETSPTLGAGANWTPVASSPVLNNDYWWFTIPVTNTVRFYRLRR